MPLYPVNTLLGLLQESCCWLFQPSSSSSQVIIEHTPLPRTRSCHYLLIGPTSRVTSPPRSPNRTPSSTSSKAGLNPSLHIKVSMAYQSGRILEIIDSRMGSYSSACIDKFALLAYSCCQSQPDARPSMSDIVRELENIWRMMPESDVIRSESSIRDTAEKASAPLLSTLSSPALTYPYLSNDVSGSNLPSSSIPNIKPR